MPDLFSPAWFSALASAWHGDESVVDFVRWLGWIPVVDALARRRTRVAAEAMRFATRADRPDA